MPKELMTGARVSVAQMGDRMYKVVAGSSRPERALKDEVIKVREMMAPGDVGRVLGDVYERLGSSERTVRVAGYMKDLYGIGSRRLFFPKASVGARAGRPLPKALKQALKGVTEVQVLNPATGELTTVKVSAPKDKGWTVVANKKSPKRKQAQNKLSENGGASGGGSNNVVNLQSVAKYCLETASHYDEVKPVYDMLMELYYNVPDEEWDKTRKEIKARMRELEQKPRVVVSENSTYIETQQIQNNVEKVDNGGEVVMEQKVSAAAKKDGRKKGGSSQKVVKAVYRYNHLKEADAYKRLELLYRALVYNEWLNSETSVDMFVDLFAGVPKEFTIKWLGTQAELYTLIKKMFDKGMIAGTKGGNKWDIAGSHFVNRKSQHYINWNKQKECKKGMPFIDDCILLLNPSVPMTGDLLRRLKIA